MYYKVIYLQKKDYTKGNLILRSSFSETYEFINQDNSQISAGIIFPKNSIDNNKSETFFKNEVNILKNLDHPYIANLEGYFEDQENYYILKEFCPHGNLKSLLNKRKTLTELEVQYYIYQIINLLIYLRRKKIIHRDLKLANLFISDK